MKLIALACVMCVGQAAAGERTFAMRSAYAPTPSDYWSEWSGHFSYVVGYKRMESKWSPAKNQTEVGLLDFDFKHSSWPVSIATEFLLSYANDRPALAGFRGNNSGTYEFNIGPRKIFENSSPFQPFLGTGLSVIGGSTSTSFWFSNVREESDTGVGYYLEGGVYWLFGRNWDIGVRVEYSSADIKLFGTHLDAGGVHAMAMLGVHW